MPDIEVIINERQVKSIQRLIAAVPKAWPKIATRAINKTARTLRSRLVKRIARRAGVKQKGVRAHTRIRKANYNKLAATIVLRSFSVPLIEFGARQTRKGVTYKSGAGRTLIPHTFIATMPGGHEGVFRRVGPAAVAPWGRDKDSHGLPIKELFGPSIMGVFLHSEDIERKTMAEGGAVLEHNLDQEVGRVLEAQA